MSRFHRLPHPAPAVLARAATRLHGTVPAVYVDDHGRTWDAPRPAPDVRDRMPGLVAHRLAVMGA